MSGRFFNFEPGECADQCPLVALDPFDASSRAPYTFGLLPVHNDHGTIWANEGCTLEEVRPGLLDSLPPEVREAELACWEKRVARVCGGPVLQFLSYEDK